MKSTDVYKILRLDLGPSAKALGFKRTSSGMLGWHRPLGEEHLVFWFQCSQSGWDPYTGSQFTLEFQKGPGSEIGYGVNRLRYYKLLTPSELEALRQRQNRVIQTLVRPPRGHWTETMPMETQAWYRRQFEPLAAPLQNNQDVWLRYAAPDHVKEWAAFLQPLLSDLLGRFERHPPIQLASGV